MENENPKCCNCGSNETIKWAKRKTQHRGIIIRYKCKDCGKTFCIDDGFWRMRKNEKQITSAIDLFFNGISTRKIERHFKSFYPTTSSNTAVYYWIVKYSNMISEYTENLKIKNGSVIEMDEMTYHRRLSPYTIGRTREYHIDSIDLETRFIVASKYSPNKSMESISEVVKEIRDKTKDLRVIRTDDNRAYLKPINKYWRYGIKKDMVKVRHQRINNYWTGAYNVGIERLHQTIRERTFLFKCFHGSLYSAQSIMRGFKVYYNFVRKHQGINCCPYELAIPTLKLGDNKWLDLIKLSKSHPPLT